MLLRVTLPLGLAAAQAAFGSSGGSFATVGYRGDAIQDQVVPLVTRTRGELSIDRQGRLWIGYHRGGVSVLDRGTQQFFGAESGLAGGPVQEIYQDGSGAVWVGSGEGLSRYRNGRWTSWGVRQGLPEGVQGITATAEGDLWLLTAAGLLRLSGTELSNTPDSSPSNLSFRVYGPLDGIQFSASRRMVNPREAGASAP